MTADEPPGGPAGGAPVSDRLQALLARAAQEQIVEQRQASAVLTELRALVAGLEEQLRGAASAARLEEVADSVAELRRDVDGLGERIAAELAPRLADLVREAGEDRERRLRAHVDDAVMALAEVLLRRRRGRPAEPLAPQAAGTVAAPADQDDAAAQRARELEEEVDRALDLAATPEASPADEAQADEAQADEAQADEAQADEAPVDEGDRPTPQDAAEPGTPSEQDHQDQQDDGDEAAARPRPWWRPTA